KEQRNSRFALTPDDLGDDHEALTQRIRADEACAFKIGENVKPVLLSERRHQDYGVVVARRQPGGQVWMLVGGASGPGTYAAALALAEGIETSLPRPD